MWIDTNSISIGAYKKPSGDDDAVNMLMDYLFGSKGIFGANKM